MTSSSSSSALSTKREEISQAEAELYDRQIRLWGLDAQNRLRNSSVLLVGLSGLGAEVAKNLTLAGVKSLTIMDDKVVSEDDFSSQFLISPDSLSQNRATASKHKTQVLNPMVELVVCEESVEMKQDSFFDAFNLVILIDQKYDLINKINKICRSKGIRFQAGGVYGWTGFAFFDCNNHLFLLPKPKVQPTMDLDDSDDEGGETKKAKVDPSAPVTTIEDDEEQKIQQKVPFSSFENAFNINWDAKQMTRRARRLIPSSFFHMRALLRKWNESDNVTVEELYDAYKSELEAAHIDDPDHVLTKKDLVFFSTPPLSAVSAIVGSIIGQEAIKALSQNDVPLKNTFMYSALETSGVVSELPPKVR